MNLRWTWDEFVGEEILRWTCWEIGETQITLVLEGFRTNQVVIGNRLGQTDTFGEKKSKNEHFGENLGNS